MHVPPAIQAALLQAVDAGVFPGAVLAIRRGRDCTCIASAGRLSIDPPGGPISPATVYDLASLTKPLATVTSLALLVQEEQCRVDDPVGLILFELRHAPVGSSTLRDLLTHSSGLPGWRGYYEQLCPEARLPHSAEARANANHRMLQLILQEPLIYTKGAKSLYSDLGFILLGMVIERLSGVPLDQFVLDRIARPCGAQSLGYIPTSQSHSMAIAPTEFDSWRKRLLCGEVHDENAAALGGVAGHAGLFGTAESILTITGAWMHAYNREPSVLDTDVVREFSKRQGHIPESSWALGWDTPSAPSSSGQYFSPQSFGHLGYTGTSIWVDPAQELEVVLLSNRVHPSRKNDAIRRFRPVIHDLVYREFVGIP